VTRAPALTSRARSWLVAATVLILSAAYLTCWATYAYVHLSGGTRHRVLDPGQSAVIPDATVRLTSLSQAAELADQKYGSEPSLPPPGAVWVVAVLEVTTTPADGNAHCDLRLVGPDRRLWQAEALLVRRTLPSSCSDDEVTPGRPATIEVDFAVPERFAGEIVGVAVLDPASAARTQVLRPG
jgi:hypothetical protein